MKLLIADVVSYVLDDEEDGGPVKVKLKLSAKCEYMHAIYNSEP